MASVLAKLPPPPLFNGGRQPLLINLEKVTLAAARGRQGRIAISTKAMGDSSESSTSLIKSVQNLWDNSEDRVALFGLGFAAVVAVWASANLITAIDKLPIIPTAFELVGILFSSWFVYRYLLFQPDREELFSIIKKSATDILGQ